MSEKLKHISRGADYIAWVDENGEEGLVLGPRGSTNDVETDAAIAAISALNQPSRRVVSSEWYWDSPREAHEAIRAAKLAIKAAKTNRPMPEWALKALNAGWKAPKGWVP